VLWAGIAVSGIHPTIAGVIIGLLTPVTAWLGPQGFLADMRRELEALQRAVPESLSTHDFAERLQHVAVLRRTVEEVVGSEPRARAKVDVRPQYPNMRSYLEPFPEIVQTAERAIRAEGIEPVRTPIRGGTDGSRLSAMGLPTPNIFTGGHEYHSVREWASLQEMAAAAATVVRLAGEWARAPRAAGAPVTSVQDAGA